jgi:ligand-binding sensor domain-containing protein
MRQLIILLLTLFSILEITAQHDADVDYYANNRIGEWESFLPYNYATDLAETEEFIFVATELSVLRIYKLGESFQRYNKLNFLSDMGACVLGYSEEYELLVVGYNNGNLDLVKDDGSTVNRPAIKLNTNINASKKIFHIHIDSNLVYLSTEFGLITFDLSNEEFAETAFTNNVKVNASTTLGDEVFISTDQGIYMVNRMNNNIQDFGSWTKVGTAEGLGVDFFESLSMATMDGMVYADVNDTIMRYNGSSWQHIPVTTNGISSPFCYTGRSKLKMKTNLSDSRLAIATNQSFVETLTPDGDFSSLYFAPSIVGNTLSVLRSQASRLWMATPKGVFRNNPDGSATPIFPDGPNDMTVSDMVVDKDGTLWCAGSPKTFNSLEFNLNGYYRYKDYEWTNFNRDTDSALTNVYGAYSITLDPQNGDAYAGSYLSGLVHINAENDSVEVIDANNNPGTLGIAVGDPLRTRVTDLKFDEEGNLWMLNSSAAEPIVVRTAEGEWYSFFSTTGTDVRRLAIDRYGYKWIVQKDNILVYDSGDDITSAADDRYLQLTTNNSDLGSSKVYSITQDRDGAIWAGTADGVTIFNCDVFQGNCPGLRPVVNPDNFNGRLLEAERVRALAVDGADRMWVGTDNGVFLIDANSYEQILFFNEENSPLFSNQTSAIAIDPLSGQVYIAGNAGLQGFRYTATSGLSFMDKKRIRIFPNPMRPEYDGQIAINGLAEDANVKITDVSGQLVFEQTAFGGQAVWNGVNYMGEEAASGVYLVFVVNDDATQKLVGKFVLVR